MCSDLKARKNNILGEIDTLNELSKGKVSKDVEEYISSRLFRLKAELDNVRFLLDEELPINYCGNIKNITEIVDCWI